MDDFVIKKLQEIKEVIQCDFTLLNKFDGILYQSNGDISNQDWQVVNILDYKFMVKDKISEASRKFIEIILSLLELKLEDEKYGKWYQLLLGESTDFEDLDEKYKNFTNINVWMILANDISKYVDEIKLLFEFSIPVVLKESKLAIIHFNNYDKDDAKGILDHIESEFMVKSKIIIGNSVNSIVDIHKSYKNANHLMKYIFRTNSSKSIFKFEDMLIENLIGKLNNEKLEETYFEYCRINDIEKLNFELIETIRAFFTNDLNITDTAMSLFLHRNTLIYRINRIESLTSLDIRKFEDALKMKIMLLIKYNI